MTRVHFIPLLRTITPPPLEFSILESRAYPGGMTEGTGVAIGNLDDTKAGDELVVGGTFGTTNQVVCYDKDGNILWSYPAPNNAYIMGIDIGDIDGDGDNEIAVGFSTGNFGVDLLDKGGNLIWHWPNSNYCRSVCIAKVRADYTGLQLVEGGYYANPIGFLKLLDKDGNLIWEIFPSATYSGTLQRVKVADMDGDGQAEIYCTQDRLVRKYDHLGNHVWSTQISDDPAGFYNRSYDLDVGLIDGNMRIAAVNETTGLTILDADGNILQQIAIPNRAGCVAIGDANNDGENEIVVGYAVNFWDLNSPAHVVIIDASGNFIDTVALPGDMAWLEIDDVNNDEKNEIVVTCDDGNLHVLGYTD